MKWTTDMSNKGCQRLPVDFVGDPIHESARITFIVIGGIMIISGVVGNASLIVIIVKRFVHHRKKCLHNIFLANLALIDILTMGYWFVFFILDLCFSRHPVINNAHCIINGMTVCVLFTAEMTYLVTIAFNRYLHVCHTRLYHNVFTLPRTLCWCLVVWVISLLFAIPPLWGGAAGRYCYSDRTRICSFSRKGFTYIKGYFILYSILPMIIIGFLNSAIFRYWKRANFRMKGSGIYPLPLPKQPIWNPWASIRRHLQMKKTEPVVEPSSATTSGVGSKASESTEVSEKRKNSLRQFAIRVSPSDKSALSKPAASCSQAGRASSQNTSTVTHLQTQRSRNQVKAKEVAFIRSLIVVCFFMCIVSVPYAITVIIDSIMKTPAEVVMAGVMVLLVNNSVNWVVYGAMNPAFRRGYADFLQHIISCCCSATTSTEETALTRTEIE